MTLLEVYTAYESVNESFKQIRVLWRFNDECSGVIHVRAPNQASSPADFTFEEPSQPLSVDVQEDFGAARAIQHLLYRRGFAERCHQGLEIRTNSARLAERLNDAQPDGHVLGSIRLAISPLVVREDASVCEAERSQYKSLVSREIISMSEHFMPLSFSFTDSEGVARCFYVYPTAVSEFAELAGLQFAPLAWEEFKMELQYSRFLAHGNRKLVFQLGDTEEDELAIVAQEVDALNCTVERSFSLHETIFGMQHRVA